MTGIEWEEKSAKDRENERKKEKEEYGELAACLFKEGAD